LPFAFLFGGGLVNDRLDAQDLYVSSSSFVQRAETWSLFARQELRRDRLALVASGRYDRSAQFGEFWSPRADVIFEASTWLRLSMAASRSWRLPSLHRLYTGELRLGPEVYTGNAALQPEKARTFDASFEVFGDSAALKTTFFRSHITDHIQTVNTSYLESTTQNVSRVRRHGVEVEGRAVSKHWEPRLNYRYLQNRGRSGAGDFDLAYVARHCGNVIVTWRPSAWSFDAAARWTGRRYSQNGGSGVALPSLVLGDVRGAYQWRQMELYIGLLNVLNRRYEETAGYPLPGMTAYGGFKLRLWG
jgi:vitamin B12 transporter